MWIEDWRLKNDISRERLGELARCPTALIGILEDQSSAVTHPQIANRIAAVTGATEEQRDSIVPKKYRGELGPIPKYTPQRRRRPKRSDMNVREGRAVVCLDKQGKELGRYLSSCEAARELGDHKKHVYERCKRRSSARMAFEGGHTFRFAAEWDTMSPEERMADIEQEIMNIPQAREVVALMRGGIETGRYASTGKAALAKGCSGDHVLERCTRRHKAKDEFKYCGCTFRYADEWDAMSPEEREKDMHSTIGIQEGA